jgi:hypothetical protein
MTSPAALARAKSSKLGSSSTTSSKPVRSRRPRAWRTPASTFGFADAYGLDPVATLLLNRLVEILLTD